MQAEGSKQVLDEAQWNRSEHFRHFYDEAPCAVSLCDDIDVTSLTEACRQSGTSFYISVLYLVSCVINAHEEFRMTTVETPDTPYPLPAVWDRVHPVHNVFHEQNGTYTSIFTLFDRDFALFSRYASEDLERARRLTVRCVPAGDNIFEASCVPWRHFTSVGVQCEAFGLSPVVAWGGFRKTDGRVLLPLSIQVHHAAADGYHLARFLNETEERAGQLAETLAR